MWLFCYQKEQKWKFVLKCVYARFRNRLSCDYILKNIIKYYWILQWKGTWNPGESIGVVFYYLLFSTWVFLLLVRYVKSVLNACLSVTLRLFYKKTHPTYIFCVYVFLLLHVKTIMQCIPRNIFSLTGLLKAFWHNTVELFLLAGRFIHYSEFNVLHSHRYTVWQKVSSVISSCCVILSIGYT